METAKRIYLLDDDVEICELLQEYLSDNGFQVRTAHNAAGFFFRAGNFLFRNLFPIADTEKEADDANHHNRSKRCNDVDDGQIHSLSSYSLFDEQLYRYGDFG